MKKEIRVLLVDGDAGDRAMFVNAVGLLDKRVICTHASNGEQALDSLKSDVPDCIFLDLQMPRMDGKRCLIEIKRDERLRAVPVYIYTTSRDEEEARVLLDLGAIHFISKPNSEEEIYYVIACALEDQLGMLEHPPDAPPPSYDAAFP